MISAKNCSKLVRGASTCIWRFLLETNHGHFSSFNLKVSCFHSNKEVSDSFRGRISIETRDTVVDMPHISELLIVVTLHNLNSDFNNVLLTMQYLRSEQIEKEKATNYGEILLNHFDPKLFTTAIKHSETSRRLDFVSSCKFWYFIFLRFCCQLLVILNVLYISIHLNVFDEPKI